MQLKIYIAGERFVKRDYINWLIGSRVDSIEKADLVMFAGGEDINPKLYGEKKHFSTECNPARDIYEVNKYKEAIKLKKPMLGICRGSQFLCAMAGGILIQDQDNPYFWHWVRTNDGKRILTTSTHHQAQYPWKMKKCEYNILGWTEKISSWHSGGDGEELVHGVLNPVKEVEIAHYPKIKALGIQGHPELMWEFYEEKDVEESIDYYRNLVKKLVEERL